MSKNIIAIIVVVVIAFGAVWYFNKDKESSPPVESTIDRTQETTRRAPVNPADEDCKRLPSGDCKG